MLFRQRESFHVHDSSKKCVTVYANGDFINGKTVYIEPDWTLRDFLLAASQRLDTGWIASRLFNSDGAEVDDCMMLEDDGIAFVSNGEEFTSPVLNNNAGGGAEDGLGDISIPPVVSGYIVGTLLGRGGFGEVRLGTHQLTNEKTALKFLKKSEIISMGAAERTVTEIQCLMALKHNNIIRLFQHVEAPSHYVLIFELMEGGDLWNYLKRISASRPAMPDSGASSPTASSAPGVMAPAGGPAASPTPSSSASSSGGHPAMALSEDDARTVFQQVVSGIAYAHNQHICHRDLKLENILLKSKNLDCVKIADFGLSAFYRPGATLRTNCGTLSFLAPEVFKGTSNTGPPLDVWALGVILFALLCGRLPFEGNDLSYRDRPRTPVIRTRIIKGQYKIDESLSPEVKDLVRRMLKIDPSERASVPEVLNHFWMRSVGSNNPSSSSSSSSSNANSSNNGTAGTEGRRDSKLASSAAHMLSTGKPPSGAPGSLLPKVPSATGGSLLLGSGDASSPTSSRPSSPPGSLLSNIRSRSYSDTGFGLNEDMRTLNLPSTVDELDGSGNAAPPPFNPNSPNGPGGGDVVDQFKLVPLRRRATTASANDAKSLFNKGTKTDDASASGGLSGAGTQYGSAAHRLLGVGDIKERHTMVAHDVILSASSSSTSLPNRGEHRKSFSAYSSSAGYGDAGGGSAAATGAGGSGAAGAAAPMAPFTSSSPRPSSKRHGSAIISAANASLLSTSGGGTSNSSSSSSTGAGGTSSRRNSAVADAGLSKSSYK